MENFDTLRPKQNGRHIPDDIFKCIFLNENVWISVKIPPKFVPMGPVNNIPSLVQIVAWRRPGDKPLSEPMMVSLLTHICITRPQWVNWIALSLPSPGQTHAIQCHHSYGRHMCTWMKTNVALVWKYYPITSKSNMQVKTWNYPPFQVERILSKPWIINCTVAVHKDSHQRHVRICIYAHWHTLCARISRYMRTFTLHTSVFSNASCAHSHTSFVYVICLYLGDMRAWDANAHIDLY